MNTFKLAFDPTKIHELEGHYNYADDDVLFNTGDRIKHGEYTRTNLETVFEWKTKGRGRARLGKNTDEEIADALKLAVEAKSSRAALAVLMGLYGVNVPVASAIMTSIYPERFTIIDYRALESLGKKNPIITIDFYLDYLSECKNLADKHQVGLRTLDRALWQWSKEKGPYQRLALRAE